MARTHRKVALSKTQQRRTAAGEGSFDTSDVDDSRLGRVLHR